MLSKGNSKLGKRIHTFSLEAGVTCGGKTKLCTKHCYAAKGFFCMPSVLEGYRRNLKASERADFVAVMVTEIREKGCTVVRIHVSGDFYSAEYVGKWMEIIRQCPGVRFYAYTRSWRVAEIRPELVQLSHLRNVRLWFSCDSESGTPKRVPKRVRLAWMQTEHDDARGDLIFRVEALRPVVAKRIGLTMVCPVENGVTKTDCGKCGVCWRN